MAAYGFRYARQRSHRIKSVEEESKNGGSLTRDGVTMIARGTAARVATDSVFGKELTVERKYGGNVTKPVCAGGASKFGFAQG
jgi:hypothetical protein